MVFGEFYLEKFHYLKNNSALGIIELVIHQIVNVVAKLIFLLNVKLHCLGSYDHKFQWYGNDWSLLPLFFK
jgi:hypothetical protein